MESRAYYDVDFGCELCKYNETECFVPKEMGADDYNQWVDKPFTVKMGVDIRQVCGKDCDLENVKDGACKQDGACAWTSPDFNGACGVLPVADWLSNAYVSADACAAAYGTDPYPKSGQSFPKCSDVPSNACLTNPESPYCQSNVCKTNCYFDTVASCSASCESKN